MEQVKLVDAIAQLRRELYDANEAGKNEGLRLEIDAIDIEFEVEITKGGEVGVEFGFRVLSVGGKVKAGGELGSNHTHRLKLHLKPKFEGGSVVAVSGRSPIADD